MRKINTQKIDNYLNVIMCIIGVAVFVWGIGSWIDVICNNMTTYEYHPYNFFALLDKLCD